MLENKKSGEHNSTTTKLNEDAHIGVDGKSLSSAASLTVKRFLEVGLQLAKQKDTPITLYELDKLIYNLKEFRDSVVDREDFLVEDYSSDGDTPNAPIDGEDNGIATLLNALIKDEIEAIDGYNGAIQTILSLDGNYGAILDILNDISGEENIHIGQLQKALEVVNPQATLIKDGEKEAEETLGIVDDNNEKEANSIEESYRDVRNVVRVLYGCNGEVIEFGIDTTDEDQPQEIAETYFKLEKTILYDVVIHDMGDDCQITTWYIDGNGKEHTLFDGSVVEFKKAVKEFKVNADTFRSIEIE